MTKPTKPRATPKNSEESATPHGLISLHCMCEKALILDYPIFTLANTFLSWTYLGQTRFIHPWTTLVHAMLHISHVMDKCNCWLDDVTFNWCHIMAMAVEWNNRTRQIITFLRRLFCKISIKISQTMNKTMCKESCCCCCRVSVLGPFDTF